MRPIETPIIRALHRAVWDAVPSDCAIGWCRRDFGLIHPMYRIEQWVEMSSPMTREFAEVQR